MSHPTMPLKGRLSRPLALLFAVLGAYPITVVIGACSSANDEASSGDAALRHCRGKPKWQCDAGVGGSTGGKDGATSGTGGTNSGSGGTTAGTGGTTAGSG